MIRVGARVLVSFFFYFSQKRWKSRNSAQAESEIVKAEYISINANQMAELTLETDITLICLFNVCCWISLHPRINSNVLE